MKKSLGAAAVAPCPGRSTVRHFGRGRDDLRVLPIHRKADARPGSRGRQSHRFFQKENGGGDLR